MAAIEDADQNPLDEDFNPDFPPDFRLEADDSLAAVFDDWDSRPRRTAPSMRTSNLLTELLGLVEAWRAEGATSNERLESLVIGELKEVQGDLVSIRTSESDAHQTYRQALRSLWQQNQELTTAVQDLATGVNYADGPSQIISEVNVLRERIAEVSMTLQRHEQAITGQFGTLVTKIQDAEARTEHLMNQADGILQRLNEGLALLDARGTAALESQNALQDRILRAFEVLDERMSGKLEQSNERIVALQADLQAVEKNVADGREGIESGLAKGLEAISAGQQGLQENLENLIRTASDDAAGRSLQITKDLKEGLASLEPSHAEMKAGLSTLAQAIEHTHKELSDSGDRNRSSLLERLETLESAVGKSLSTGNDEREKLKQAVSILSDAMKQFREEVREDSGQSETRIRRQLELGETLTLEAIAEISNSLLREQRAAKLDLETKIDRGVREPLKATVTLLNRQLSEIEATVGRTFEALRNADLTIRIDNMDALIESRLRNRKADGVVVLPSGAEAPAVSKEEEK